MFSTASLSANMACSSRCARRMSRVFWIDASISKPTDRATAARLAKRVAGANAAATETSANAVTVLSTVIFTRFNTVDTK